MAEDKQMDKSVELSKGEENTEEATAKHHYWHKRKSPLMVVGAVVILALLLCLAFAAGRHSSNRYVLRGSGFGYNTQMGQGNLSNQAGDYGGRRVGMMGGFGGQNSTTTNSTRLSGVVTAVSGDTITVAGDGTTTTVTVSSNTTYSGSSQPAQVNDTILAVGAKNGDGALVASSVRLTRQ